MSMTLEQAYYAGMLIGLGILIAALVALIASTSVACNASSLYPKPSA